MQHRKQAFCHVCIRSIESWNYSFLLSPSSHHAHTHISCWCTSIIFFLCLFPPSHVEPRSHENDENCTHCVVRCGSLMWCLIFSIGRSHQGQQVGWKFREIAVIMKSTWLSAVSVVSIYYSHIWYVYLTHFNFAEAERSGKHVCKKWAIAAAVRNWNSRISSSCAVEASLNLFFFKFPKSSTLCAISCVLFHNSFLTLPHYTTGLNFMFLLCKNQIVLMFRSKWKQTC